MSFPKAVLFDFDGVIVESADIKTLAFQRLFRHHSQTVVDQVTQYHLANEGVSRYEKFRHIYRHILQQPLSDEESQRLGEDFSYLVFEQILAAPFVPGAREFLERYHLDCHCFVVSGTPQAELEQIVDRRGLRSYFRAIYGAPQTKADWIGVILCETGLTADECIFVGDAMTDYHAASVHQMPFVGRSVNGAQSPFDGLPFARVVLPDLCALETVFEVPEHSV